MAAEAGTAAATVVAGGGVCGEVDRPPSGRGLVGTCSPSCSWLSTTQCTGTGATQVSQLLSESQAHVQALVDRANEGGWVRGEGGWGGGVKGGDAGADGQGL